MAMLSHAHTQMSDFTPRVLSGMLQEEAETLISLSGLNPKEQVGTDTQFVSLSL